MRNYSVRPVANRAPARVVQSTWKENEEYLRQPTAKRVYEGRTPIGLYKTRDIRIGVLAMKLTRDAVEYCTSASTQVWTWVIRQTGIIKCMLMHSFSNPCLSDHSQPYPSTCWRQKKSKFVKQGNKRIPAALAVLNPASWG